ncbi:LysR family transcriptional regulator [Bermanella sp. WJH001]|uniref:LysR family transcriptional regulator n=1 Tax=Bermanella sp. WJH001 TaxID=3048005 RepID=UPI0024BE02DF|nr:LysR family transcriptional regulator [Bermanella sp. WJH001]MDJ1536682.1 LysR family transcriptional regulator [Bermanella sp. WJH001]
MNWTSIQFDWNHTRAFLVTAEEGTLSAAAKALGLTQPTLSRQVAALESQLQLTLFERIGQRLVLTQSGLELLEHAKAMAHGAQLFSLAASGHSQQLEGSVVISASQLDAVYRLPKIIAQLRHEEPGIEIEVVVTNETSDLKRREADIAIRNFRPEQPDLIAKKIGTENIWLYASTDYLKQFSALSPSTIADDIQIIGFERNHAVSDLLNQKGWQLDSHNFKVVTSFQMMQLELCKENLGVMFFPEGLIDHDTQLVRVFADLGPAMQLPVWLVCHQELRTNPRIKRVFDYIANALNASLATN